MTVYFIGAGPGAPDLITVRGLRLIERCPVCLYAGSLVPAEIVASAPDGALVRDTAPMHLDEIIDEITKAHAEGKDVARVHSGDFRSSFTRDRSRASVCAMRRICSDFRSQDAS